MLAVSYSPLLVAAAAAVALMASFTGLSLANGLGALPAPARPRRLAMAALALGGGVWSTHFIAMLALELPVQVGYDAVATLGSALLSVLVSGLALVALHAGPPSRARVAGAGCLMGAGVVAMHYLGMAGLRGCGASFGAAGVALAALAAAAACTGALFVVHVRRPRRAVAAGAALFALAILVMHFTAMAGTAFYEGGLAAAEGLTLGGATLALYVLVASFLICGAFLLDGAAGVMAPAALAPAAAAAAQSPAPADHPSRAVPPEAAPEAEAPPGAGFDPAARLPFEKGGVIMFVDRAEVAAVRAEGRYSVLHTKGGELFCPWSISEVEKRLPPGPFVRAHRSYLVNLDRIAGFERRKDGALCHFDGYAALASAPVSRAKVREIEERLGL
jgi:NO-binding membrane sensor protein with MHYT domain